MLTFEQFLNENNNLNERFINIIGNEGKSLDDKNKYKHETFTLLQLSYAKIGGIKGSGFNSADDMVENIPFWKLVVKDNTLLAGRLYKDSNGRKSVASFTNQTDKGKEALASIVVNDLERSMGEVSASMLGFIVKNCGINKVVKFAIPVNKAKDILGKKLYTDSVDNHYLEKFPELSEYFYTREIGGTQQTKVLLGSPYNKIVNYV